MLSKSHYELSHCQGSSQVRASLMNQINNRVTNVLCQTILRNANTFLVQVNVEDGLLQNGRFLRFFFAKDWNTAWPKHRVIKPHQLHFREICSNETGQSGYGIYTPAVASTQLIKTTLNTWDFKISAPRKYSLSGTTFM